MITSLKVFTLFAILIASIGTIPAFGQASPISVTTDKVAYSPGETVTISGEVKDLLSGNPVTLRVQAANGNVVTVQQLTVGADKKFSTTIVAEGGLWKSTGTYKIFVQYGSASRTAETTFEFGQGGGITPTPTPGKPTIKVDRTDFNVTYEIKGGSVLSITPDDDANSLIVAIETTSDGELIITLPRALIDAKMGDQDDDFFVLVDGEEVEFGESKDGSSRTLTIMFPDGAEEIEIIGTFVVPEFGTIAALILVVAIISIIAITAKTRLNVLPKY